MIKMEKLIKALNIIGVILVFLIHLACKDSEAPALFIFTDNILFLCICIVFVIVGTIQGVIEYKRWCADK